MRFLDTSKVRTRFDERVPAADGTELSLDLYLPPEPARYPVLLHRTAADNNRSGRPGISQPPAERWKLLAAQGYIVATGDVRGRGDSAGKFVPFLNEASDGAATLAWLREFEECNGKIAVLGSGYSGHCAWAAALADGQVSAIASISPLGCIGEGLLHRGGAVRLDCLFWMHLFGGRTVQPAAVPPWRTIHRHMPLNTMDEALGREDIWWRDWLEHMRPEDAFWEPLQLHEKISGLKMPGLHITGRWDAAAAATYRFYEAAQRGGAPQHLIVGPWDGPSTRRPAPKVGGFDFGPRSILDIDETVLGFFAHYLQAGEPTRVGGELKRSRVFLTGRNEWQDTDDSPPVAAKELEWYLTSELGANTRRGDGALQRDAPSKSAVDIITHNPAWPVEFQTQFVSFADSASFSLEQAHITSRDEALVYTSIALSQSLVMNGRPKVSVVVRTDALDSDLYFLLSNTFPRGVSDLHLAHTAVRLAMLPAFRPGQPLRIELSFDPIAHEFMPGHHIRLTIVPSLFPLYARNLQGGDYCRDRAASIADIALLSGPQSPATLVLPIAH